MDLKIISYDYETVGQLSVRLEEILNRLYEILIPRHDSCIRNLSINNEKIFTLLLAPIISVYKDVVKYNNLANYDKDQYEESQITVITNPKLCRKFGIDKMCNTIATRNGTRMIVIDNSLTTFYPSWAYTGSTEENKIFPNFFEAFDRIVFTEDNPIDDYSEKDLIDETGHILIHLAHKYFSGGLHVCQSIEEIEKLLLEERGSKSIIQRNKNMPNPNTPSKKKTIPILTKEQLLKLKEQEAKSSQTPTRSSIPGTPSNVPNLFNRMMPEWTSYGEDSSNNLASQVNIYAIRPELPIPI